MKALQNVTFQAPDGVDLVRSWTDLMRRRRHLLRLAQKSIQRVRYLRSSPQLLGVAGKHGQALAPT